MKAAILANISPPVLAVLAAASFATNVLAQSDGEPRAPLFVLGDSLSDVGNAAAVADFLLGTPFHPEPMIGLCNPADLYLYGRGCGDILFRQSRVSDGPTAVEYLAWHLGVGDLVASYHTVPDRPIIGTSYAVASGKARGDGIEDLSRQVEMLLLDHGPVLPLGARYVVMIGGNDAIDALQAVALPALDDRAFDPGAEDGTAEEVETLHPIIDEAVTGIGDAVVRLAHAGAECVIVANVPNLAALPAVRATAAREGIDEQTALARGEAVSTRFNERLEASLSGIAATHPELELVPFDLFTLLDAARASAAEAGINGVDACFDSEAYRASFAAKRRFHEDCAPAVGGGRPSFDAFFFWDGIHPTGAAHAALGQALIEVADASCAAVPPPSKPLLR